ncbi:hypothetical protein AAG906_024720 [Vitis piasezkii]
MEVVGEVVLSVSLELLFSKLASSDLWKYARQKQVHTELKKWKTRLLEIREVLDDAEDKQITKQHVKAWLAHLRDLAYDVEDVLDEFGYQVMRRKLVAEAGVQDRGHHSPIRRNFISEVSIVAMGGMGKTTLAGLVYDDEETFKHFALKAWVCVSDQFDVETITRAVLQQIAPGNNDSQDFHQTQRKLRNETKEKDFDCS